MRQYLPSEDRHQLGSSYDTGYNRADFVVLMRPPRDDPPRDAASLLHSCLLLDG